MTAPRLRNLFGTDGIRAIAGESPLDPITIFATGLALAHSLRKTCRQPAVLLGRDTRESSPWIAAVLAAGLRAAAARVESAGIVPTPAVAFLARTHGFQAGVVISASHNPWRDNGIKFFGADGFKLPDSVELAMEDEILHHASQIAASDPGSPRTGGYPLGGPWGGNPAASPNPPTRANPPAPGGQALRAERSVAKNCDLALGRVADSAYSVTGPQEG